MSSSLPPPPGPIIVPDNRPLAADADIETAWAANEIWTFWGGWGSSFDRRPIMIANPWTGTLQSYRTVEHYFQAYKADCETDHDWVAEAHAPKQAKRRGSRRGEKVTADDSEHSAFVRKISLRPDWEEISFTVMLAGHQAKYVQHPERAALLLGVDKPFIAEDSPYDAIWGIRARDGSLTGRNLLGQVLMLVRRRRSTDGYAM
jgi:ribA/ribD-fused uncharacterized protein